MFEYLKGNQIYSDFYQHAMKAEEAWNAGNYKLHADECSLACLSGIRSYIKTFKVPCADANSVLFYINRTIFQSKINGNVKSAILYIEIVKDMANANDGSLTMNDLRGCLRNLDVFGTWLYQNLGEYANVPPVVAEPVVAPVVENPQVTPVIPVVQPAIDTPVVEEYVDEDDYDEDEGYYDDDDPENPKVLKEAIKLGVPVEYLTALNSAKESLKYEPYSKQGLKESLEYEGYTAASIKYALEHLEVDWQQQAILAAKDNLKYEAYSKKGLYWHLVYEKFSKKDAKFAVENIVVDWNAMAVKSAKEYLKSDSYSKKEMYDQLIYEKFSKEEAQYAVDEVYK